jgi:hypothetical protein
MVRSPAKSPFFTNPKLIVLIASDLEGDVEAGAEDVGEDVPFEDAVPSAGGSSLSDANWAETPEELVQVDGGVPFPVTKFTAMHCSSERRVRKASHTVHGSGRPTEQPVQNTLKELGSTPYLIMHSILGVLDDLEQAA